MHAMDGKRVLITGGLGFIGSNLAHRLVASGADVTLYDACLNPYGWNFANIKEIRKNVRVVKGDVRDIKKTQKNIKGMDVVIDCAAQVSHTISVRDPFLDIDINCRGAMSVLEGCRKADAKHIYAGTRGQIGRLEYTPADEKHPSNPMDINGINKLAAEKYCLLYGRIYGLRTCSLRINNTYGPRCQVRHDDYGVINYFIRQAILGEQITIHGEGLQTRDYNYVDDVSDAIILACHRKEAEGECFNLGSGRETRLIDMVKLILKTAGSEMEIKRVPRPEERRAIEIGNFLVTYDKIKRVLGWEPKTGLEGGIRKTVEFYRERIAEYL